MSVASGSATAENKGSADTPDMRFHQASAATRPGPRRSRKAGGDAGMTMIELLVAMFIFLVLSTILLTGVMAVRGATTAAEELNGINEQARVATERMTRELRQAERIRSVVFPASPGGDFEMTFEVDFNDNGTVDEFSADPEVLTYRYTAAAQRLTLTANDESGTAVTRPILADDVTAFDLAFASSLWQYDQNRDGTTTWQEIDSQAGNADGVLDDPELAKIDVVTLTITLMDGPRTQTYQTTTGLRNRAQN